ncbi:hypothetical protein FOCC_FOCC004982 [Frankliniella occidentalis]|uniref:2-(3-amino-3-carboxypropyl)histidine synthase subunit 2 n=1 Tax=Frankliniella occidentalis TaxID=133901 RepID=A0A6J1SMS7_FRAOC|nr:2-(3-amino-3-carboxypropyl)histidine synthase subunit 2 isoform X1 [Frankliniella occidentalis]KAE8748346.1 hypothetical protein FOCC_FOCC004982 [Frankliniella occidentalis]
MAAFSSDEQRCIEQQIYELSSVCPTPPDRIRNVYELDRCDQWINANGLSKVCLQFPDNLLCDSPDVLLSLRNSSGAQCFILGDTSYGSCCVDEVSAEHVQADGIIHFGHACLSLTIRLPVLYIFQSKPLDVQNLMNAISARFEDCNSSLLVIYDVAYSHKIADVDKALTLKFPNAVSARPTLSNSAKEQYNCLGSSFTLPDKSILENYNVLYIGHDGRTFTNYLLELAACKLFRYDPEETQSCVQPADGKISKFLMKRLHLVERVKDARTLGILIGTLGVEGYLDAVDRVKLLAKKTGKKTYIFAVGRPNIPKLANFPEVDVFVLIACPENSLFDWKEFYQPVVSIYEVELACNSAREWSSKYVIDFRQLLSGGGDHVELSDTPEDTLDVSLITGKVRNIDLSSSVNDSEERSVAARADLAVCVSTGSQFLSNRSWQGLEQSLGQTPVELASVGRIGVASSYQSEPLQRKLE